MHWFSLKHHLLFIICISVLMACADRGDTLDSAAVESEVRDMLADYFDATRSGGILAGLPFLDTSSQFFWVPPDFDSAISYDSVVAVLTAAAPGVRSVSNEWRALDIHVLDRDIASFTGRIRSRVTSTDGATTLTQMLETGVAIKRRDGWKLLCGQTRVVN